MSAGSGCPGSSLELSEEGGTIRHLLEFYVVLALFLLSFNLVPCHSFGRTSSHVAFTYIRHTIQPLYHIALDHSLRVTLTCSS